MVAVLLFGGASCAAHQAPTDGPGVTLTIRDRLADSAQLCVPIRAFTSAPLGCLTVGEIRRTVRARVVTEVLP